MNGRAWSDVEDKELVQAVAVQASTIALAARLGRTHTALMARAKRMGLKGF